MTVGGKGTSCLIVRSCGNLRHCSGTETECRTVAKCTGMSETETKKNLKACS